MPKRLLLFALLAYCCCPYSAFAQLRFKKDDTWRYHLRIKDSISPADVQTIEEVMRITITGVNPDGSANAESVLESAVINKPYMGCNSKDPATYTSGMGPMTAMLLLYQPLAFQIFPDDSIGHPTNADLLADKMAASLGLPDETRTILASNWKAMSLQLQYLFPAVPEKFRAGYEWKTPHGQYRVGSRLKEVIAIVGKSEDKGEVTYLLYQNAGNVMALKSRKGTVTTQVTKLGPDAEGPPADTAYYHTLIRMSRSSSYLRINKEPDSARVVQFLAINEPLYGNRPTFKVAKLDVFGFGSAFMSEQYDKALKATPAYLLPSYSSHLINKLILGLPEHVDSGMVMVKIMTGSPATFNYWLDNFFGPALQQREQDTVAALKAFRERGLPEDRIAEIMNNDRKTEAFQQGILGRLILEKDSLIQVSVRPMFLWNKAMHTTDTAILKNVADAFQHMSAEEMTWGKAARYELLTLAPLRKAGMDATADALLDETVAGLNANLNDTTFWSRHPDLKNKKYANKYLLAHACFLQYQRALPRDKKAALNYLALAAGNAPKSNAEKVFESRTDKNMLQSEDSYGSRFAQELEALGKPEEAMKILSRQLLVQPEMLDSAKAYFEAHFSGKSFPQYFREVLLKEWEAAPDFSVTGMNNQSIRLSDYKGKWLLLDFWGTWCSPCREELPHLDKLAAEMNAGQHPGKALLAISCGESLETARNFVTAKQYVFAAAHSDGKVEKSYKISGYPTKVLVSPEGKMLALQFGADYTAIFQAYSTVYYKQDQEPLPTMNTNNKKD